jgi:tripartite-type tricarboxylate transporter receptor subunit TctC
MKSAVLKFVLACSVTLSTAMSLSSVALAQTYPTKPLRLIVGYLPGGVVDSVARLLQNSLSQGLGEPVIIDNVAGASGAIGTSEVARARPDGYTLLMTFDNHAVAPLLTHNAPYDAFKDFSPISLLVRAPMLAVASNAFAPNDMQELAAYARANPGRVTYGAAGMGTSSHLTGELFDHSVGVSMMPVFYKGGSQVQVDLMSGRLNLFWAPTSSLGTLMNSHKVKILGQASAARSSSFPNVKTIAEQGLPAVDAFSWIGISAPANTPQPIIDRLHAELVRAGHDPAIVHALQSQGYELVFSTPEYFATFMRAEYEKWKHVIDEAHITAIN